MLADLATSTEADCNHLPRVGAQSMVMTGEPLVLSLAVLNQSPRVGL